MAGPVTEMGTAEPLRLSPPPPELEAPLEPDAVPMVAEPPPGSLIVPMHAATVPAESNVAIICHDRQGRCAFIDLTRALVWFISTFEDGQLAAIHRCAEGLGRGTHCIAQGDQEPVVWCTGRQG